MSQIPLNEKLLVDAAGWDAMKEARGLLAAGRVLEAKYEPPNLLGRVRGGEVEYRSGLRIQSRTDIENLCTCADSRRRSIVCGHSIAVGLAVLKGGVSPPPATTSPATGPGATPTEHATPFSTTEGEPCALHVILPPNF